MTTELGRGMAINTSSVVELSTASQEELGGEMLQVQAALWSLASLCLEGVEPLE